MTTNQIPYLERLREELVTSIVQENARVEGQPIRPPHRQRWWLGSDARKLVTIAIALALAAAATVVAVRAFRPAERRVPLGPETPAVRWVREITGASDGATGVASDASGVYVTGFAKNPLEGQTKRGMFVRKYDPDGNEMWTRQFGGDAGSIAVDPTGVYVSGGTWLRKLDTNGAVLWRYAIPGAPTLNTDSDPNAFDATGVYIAACGSVRKLDSDGNELWTVDGPCGATDLALDATGLYAVTITGSRFEGDIRLRKYSLDGATLWTATLPRGKDGGWGFAHLATVGEGIELLTSSPACDSGAPVRGSSCLLQYGRDGGLIGSSPVEGGYDFFVGDLIDSPFGTIVTGQHDDDTSTHVGFLEADGAISSTVTLEGNRWPVGLTADATGIYVAGLGVDGRERRGFVARLDVATGSA
jgi:hypothetical protein